MLKDIVHLHLELIHMLRVREQEHYSKVHMQKDTIHQLQHLYHMQKAP